MVTVRAKGFVIGLISINFIKTLGKTLCLIAIAMDLTWGSTGILSLGHFAFFSLCGHGIGTWLMYERTRQIVVNSLPYGVLPRPTKRFQQASATRYLALSAAVNSR